MVQHQRAAAAIVQEDPNIDGFMSAVGVGGRTSTVNQGRLIIHLKPARRARDDAPTKWPGPSPGSSRRCRACGCSSRTRRCINIGGPGVQERIPVHPQSSDIEALYQGAAALEQRMQERARPHRRHQRPPDQEPAGAGGDRPRPRRGARHRREPDRERALQRVRRPAGEHHLHPERPVLGGDGAAAPVPAGPLRHEPAAPQRTRRGVGAAGQPGPGDAGHRPADGEPLRASSRR